MAGLCTLALEHTLRNQESQLLPKSTSCLSPMQAEVHKINYPYERLLANRKDITHQYNPKHLKNNID